MMKYYVDSGNLKTVIDAKDSLDACAKSIYKSISKDRRIEEVPAFEQQFIVSQKGFATERIPFQIEIPFEEVIDADDVLAYYGEHY